MCTYVRHVCVCTWIRLKALVSRFVQVLQKHKLIYSMYTNSVGMYVYIHIRAQIRLGFVSNIHAEACPCIMQTLVTYTHELVPAEGCCFLT